MGIGGKRSIVPILQGLSDHTAHVWCREYDAGIISESVCDGRETDVRLSACCSGGDCQYRF